MKKYNIIAILLTCCNLCFAEDIFIANTDLGVNDGTSCANAHGVVWLNTSTNWGSGIDNVSTGDTVHLCGTISSPITVQGDGSEGNNITILFESGAKLSRNTWGEGGYAIAINGKKFIVIDGGTNGIIEATNNGTALTYQDYATYGILASGATNVEVKRLTIRNIFVRTPATNGIFGGNGVRFNGVSTNIAVDNNNISYANGGVYIAYANGSDNVNIYNNVITHGANGIVVGNNGVSVITNLKIYGNSINLYDDASDSVCGNTFHNDGMQIFAVTSGSSVTSPRIYGNTIGPNMGECTATTGWIFLSTYVASPLVYNNVLLLSGANKAPTNGFIYVRPTTGYIVNAEIYNNTIVSNGDKGTGINDYNDANNGLVAKNNILVNVNYGIYIKNLNYNAIDYNLYYSNGTNGHTDAHGVTLDPLLNTSYMPQIGSPAIDAASPAIASFSTDKDGNIRPKGARWDIGAYEVDTGLKYPNQPTQIKIN